VRSDHAKEGRNAGAGSDCQRISGDKRNRSSLEEGREQRSSSREGKEKPLVWRKKGFSPSRYRQGDDLKKIERKALTM